MTLSQMKREVNALKRKYARALIVVRLRRLATEFCDEWEANQLEGKPPMQDIQSGQWFIKRGYTPNSFNALFDCVRRSKEKKEPPVAIDLVKALIPWSWPKYRTLIDNIIGNGHRSVDQPPRRTPEHHNIDPASLPPAFPITAPQDWPWPIRELFPSLLPERVCDNTSRKRNRHCYENSPSKASSLSLRERVSPVLSLSKG